MENVMNVTSYLFSWSKVNAAQPLPAETVGGGTLLQFTEIPGITVI